MKLDVRLEQIRSCVVLKDAIAKNFVANEHHSFTSVFTFSVVVVDLPTDRILTFLFPAETDVLVPVFSQSTDVVVVTPSSWFLSSLIAPFGGSLVSFPCHTQYSCTGQCSPCDCSNEVWHTTECLKYLFYQTQGGGNSLIWPSRVCVANRVCACQISRSWLLNKVNNFTTSVF